MGNGRRGIDAIFAVIVIGLISTAVWSAFFSGKPLIKPAAAPSAAEEALPENHPPADIAQKLADLIRKSAEDPQDATIQAEIGNIYYDSGDYEKAARAYQKSLEIRPHDPLVETDMATCFHYLNRDDEALKTLEHVLEYSPDFPQALYNKGIVLINGKMDIQGGIKAWEKLLQQDLDPARRAELEKSIQQLKSSVP